MGRKISREKRLVCLKITNKKEDYESKIKELEYQINILEHENYLLKNRMEKVERYINDKRLLTYKTLSRRRDHKIG